MKRDGGQDRRRGRIIHLKDWDERPKPMPLGARPKLTMDDIGKRPLVDIDEMIMDACAATALDLKSATISRAKKGSNWMTGYARRRPKGSILPPSTRRRNKC